MLIASAAILLAYVWTARRALLSTGRGDVRIALGWLGLVVAIAGTHRFGRRPRVTAAWVLLELAGALVMAWRSGHFGSLVIAAALCCIATAWGATLLDGLGARPASRLDRLAIAAPLGLSAAALAALGLLVTGRFTRPWAFSVLGVAAALQARRCWRAFAAWRRSGWGPLLEAIDAAPPETGILLSALGAVLLALLPWAFAPEVQYDSLTYHLAVPRIWIQQHRLVDVPEVINSYFCHSAEALFGLAMLLRDDAAAHLLTLFMGVIAALGTFALGRALFDARSGLWAGALFLTTPLVLWLLDSTFIDVTVAMFAVAALLAWYRWADDGAGRDGLLWACGLLCGAAMGAKITSASLFPFILVAAAWRLLRERGRSLTGRALALAGLAATVAVFLVPWLAVVRGFTGNPIFPFLPGIFGGRRAQLTLEAAVSAYNIGSSPSALVRFPFVFTFGSTIFGLPMVDGGFGVTVLLFLLVLVPNLLRARGPRLVLLTTATVALLFFIVRVQYGRYLVPCWPLLAVWAVGGLASGASVWEGTILAGFVVAQVPLVLPLYWQVPERIPLRLALGLEPLGHFRARAVEGQAVDDYLNQMARPGDRVLSLDTEVYRYNLEIPMERPATSTTGLNATFSLPPGRELAERLLGHGFRWVVMNPSVEEPWQPLRRPGFLSSFAVARFSAGDETVYELCPTGCPSVRLNVNLLQNPGFEELNATGAPVGWTAYGKPSVVTGDAHSGAHAVEARPDDGFFQQVRVQPGRRYLLRHYSRGRGAQAVRLQLNWTDLDSRLIRADIQLVPASGEWAEHELEARAPDDAAYVEVYVSTQGTTAQFDDYFLSDVTASR
jgi:hypothetical protein